VERSSIRVTLKTVPTHRLSAPVEAAAYFVVSEALANVAKHARATSATISANATDGRLVVEVADDGVGGADPTHGSGLRGLADRVAALDGSIRIESAGGKGTVIRAEIPCA
jgi:signal transduction histidine kinase